MDARKIQIYERTIEVGKLARTRENSSIVTNRKTEIGFLFFAFLFAVLPLLSNNSVYAQAAIRLPGTGINYEDSVRIVVLWNNPRGNCGWMDSVGAQTRDFILKSLSTNTTTTPPAGHLGNLLTTINPNVKIIPTHKADGTWTTWNDIVNLWGANRLPHVIVHSNAGWGDATYNGPTTVGTAEGPIWALFDSATAHYIGIAEVGDDAAWLATNTFGFTLTNNMPPPINDGIQYTASTDSLLIGLHPNNDHLLDSTKYPYLNGVVRNTAYTVLNDSTIYFKPYINQDAAGGKDTIRCQADADKYTILPGQASKLTMLGYENAATKTGAYAGRVIPADPTQELDVVVAFQDTITKNGAQTIRRAVALSMEPQFLKKTQAMYQLTYDAVMYASLAWQNRPPSGIQMGVSPDTNVISAGDSIVFKATVEDGSGSALSGYDQSVKWTLWTWVPPNGVPVKNTTASYNTAASGVNNTFKAIDAYSFYIIMANLDTISAGGTGVHLFWADTVYVQPGKATHLNIEASADSMVSRLNDARLGSITMSGTTQKDSVYAVLRDQFGNWVSHATLASWLSRNTAVVTDSSGRTQLGEGVITRQAASNATTYITATQGNFTDSLQVILSNVTYSSIQIYVISGGVKPIDTLRMRTDQDTTLHARGLRADGSGTFDDLIVQWGNSSGLTFNNSAPTTGAFTWEFVPQTPATGIIYASFTSGGTLLRDTIQVVFSNGLPNNMRLYPQAGKPDTGTNIAFNAGATITATAGMPLSIAAKLFDNKGMWLNAYERSGAPFAWTITDASVGSIDSLHGFITNFIGRKAYSTTTITATFQENGITLTQSISIYVTPGPANHLTIEADTSRATSPNSDNRAVRISIDSSSTTANVYAILRDQFGNWVGYSMHTTWSVLDTSRVTAAAGITTIGQGTITRVANTGQTYVRATDQAGFMDSVLVVLSTVTYDSLRIVVNDSVQITNLTMRTDQDTSLQVLGRRSDTKTWESVPGNWAIAPSVSITPSPAQNSNYWGPFTPNDTGHGTITVSFAKAVPASITFTFTHGLPARIAIYPSDGAPSASNAPYPGPTTAIIDTAGRPLTMVIKVFDKNNIWLSSYQGDSLTTFKWNIQELIGNPPTGTLSGVIGYKSSFNPVRAYNSVYIIATFDTAGAKYYDTVQVQVVPGAPKQLVIEADQNWQNSPNKANPVDSIQINSSETYRDVYAIVRDSLGNFIKYSLQTNWTSINNSKVFDTSVVSAQNGLNSIGQGVVKRVGAQGTAWVVASSGEYSGLTDTIKATVLAYYYTQLRIISHDTTRMGTLTMSTNDDTTLSAIGLRSDTAKWEPVSVEWDTSAAVHVAPSAPERSINWAFSPVTPGNGWIRITLGSDATTKPDTVFVNFTRGAPTSISIQLITPPSQIIAGDTVIAVVSIRNKDGLVPDTLCDTTSYQELLGSGGGGRPNPIVSVDGTTSGLKQAPSYSTPTYECFNNGLDTVKYVFYYAPVDKVDSLQQIFVDFHNLSASTPGFNVLPGVLSSLAIQNVSGKNLDTVNLTYPNGAQTMVAVGFDAFGNIVSLDNGANWTQTNTLHSIDKPTGVTRIYYDASDVKSDEQGYIKAVVVDAKGVLVQDSVYVSIVGQPTSLKTAVTEDLNGNGYLDAIVLHFDKLTTIPAGYNFDSLISVSYNYGEQNVLFPIDSIAGVPSDSSGITLQARTDSVFTIYLDEKNSIKMHLPQTAWTPSISLSGLVATTPVNNKVTIDGAGPVVWTVVKSITQLTNRTSDLVTVTFSEPIQQSNGSAFNLKTPPDSVFNVWKDSSGVLVLDTNLLSGIKSFASISSDGKTVTFYMDNGADLTGLDFISLKSDSSKIVDQANQPNAPSKINQKMPVNVVSHTPNIVVVAPNPAPPSNVHPGNLDISYNANALQWAQTDGGVALDFKVPATSDSSNSITGYIKIFDVIGNLVCEAGDNKTNLLKSANFSGNSSVQDYYIYWNGLNAKQRKVAPGIYRAILYLTTTSTGSTERLIATIGIRR